MWPFLNYVHFLKWCDPAPALTDMVIKYFGHCRSEKKTKVSETLRLFQQSKKISTIIIFTIQIWSMISDHLKKIITSILIWQPPPPHQCSMLEWSIKSVKRPNGRFPHPAAPFQTDWTGFGLRRPVDTTQLYYLHLCPLYICVHYTLSHRINQFLTKMPWDIYLRSIIVVHIVNHSYDWSGVKIMWQPNEKVILWKCGQFPGPQFVRNFLSNGSDEKKLEMTIFCILWITITYVGVGANV